MYSVENTRLDDLLGRLENGGTADREEIQHLLELVDQEQISRLFDTASRVRNKQFGNQVFLYGFLYFSTFCRNNCRFCRYRRSNTTFDRYRKTPGQILAAAGEMAASGVHLIDLTMGEDPVWYENGASGFNRLVDLAQQVRTHTGLPVMMSPGAVPDEVLVRLARLGIQWYACYQETHNPDLYARLRQDQDYTERWRKKQLARDLGMLVEEGILTGVGETSADLSESILRMRDFPVDQARVMTFVPDPGTPMAHLPPQDNQKENLIIAVMRLVMPDRLIPASLDVDGLDGLASRLRAGANVVTSIVPPEQGLAGVAHHCLDIEDSRRSLDHIQPVLDAQGLEPASASDYREWVTRRMAANLSTRCDARAC